MSDGVASALGLPTDAVIGPVRNGASGSAWRVTAGDDRWILRLEASLRMTDSRLAAMAAAHAAGLPVPRLVRRAETDRGHAVLLSWLPGISMVDAILRDPSSAHRWGERAGALHRRLHAVVAPPDVIDVRATGVHPFAAGRDTPGLPSGTALLHLDWHPGNLVVDEASGEISGIVDWDNARAGHPWLDLARTDAMLEADPSVRALPAADWALLERWRAGWARGYGTEVAELPSACLAWAGRVMLADLAPRFGAQELEHLRAWTASHGKRVSGTHSS